MKIKQLDRLVVRVVGLVLAVSLVLSPVLPGVQADKVKLWVETDLVLSSEPVGVLPDNPGDSAWVMASGYREDILPVNSLVPASTRVTANKPVEPPQRALVASVIVVAPPASVNANVNVPAVIAQAASEYGVDGDIMVKIAQCESGLRPQAVNGPYAGIFQFEPGTWVSNRNAMGLDPNPALRYDPVEAAKTAAFKMARDGYGAWPACSRKALAGE